MSTLITPFGTLPRRNAPSLHPLTYDSTPMASAQADAHLLALAEHATVSSRDSPTVTQIILAPAPERQPAGSDAARDTPPSKVDDGEFVGPDVSEAEHDYLDGLDFEDALIHRSQALGMVPLDFLHWDPLLIDHALIKSKPHYFVILKRLVDIAGSLVIGLLVLPLIPFIALAIKLDSPGPVIYSQTRLGQGGRPFQVYKFRSMCNDADVRGEIYSTPDDPRITKVGCFIRKTRIDELPQLWNVLKGEMSLIGPRPERPEMLSKIQDIAPEFSLRTAVKPGLTGWAQTVYHYAGTAEELQHKLEYDLYYIEFDNIRLENLIALRTIKAILLGKGR